jgi:hypothetical protein|tara:strand:+ start:397 stop:711 length:315 start_codon:yes stop_codon:yes gene_type:complete
MAITNYQVLTNYDNPAFQAAAETAVTVIYITNKTDGDGTVDIYVVPNGGSVGEPFKIYTELTIKARDTYILDTEKLILETGARIYIVAPDSSAQFNATISTIGL